MRINTFIARCGITSRRKADELILEHRVTINGEVLKEPGVHVGGEDIVEVDGKRITLPEETIIIALYKPRGVTTTLQDAHAEKTIADLLPSSLPRLSPIGRLDKESEGLLLLTNDGEFLQQLTHPSFAHEKEYEVHTEKLITDSALKRMAEGIELEEGKTLPAITKRISQNVFSIILKQGLNRQIRRMVAACGNRVTLLKRVRVGQYKIGSLQPGHIRHVSKQEIV